ncbi:hypothetical protein TIFTF001_034441 [Ficus carica]|uniref:F-box domain-containing protein n=1 Tax=Ficus carica TaxID=3494 RepID=A0AA88DZX4_FICCA|nr:hypothetical protein TIFTF001_034441 [Ficus carica]
MAIICELPEEVVEEIMLRLSPEALKQFKCVSKTWYASINALINNPAFVVKHLEITKRKMLSSRFLQFRNLTTVDSPLEEQEGSVKNAKHFLTLTNDDHNNSDYIPCVTKDPNFLPLDNWLTDFFMVGNCNGIICLSRYSSPDIILLLNPALRETKVLFNSLICDYYKIRYMGFGYDSGANDYKFVVVGAKEYRSPIKADVYTLRTESWKEIQVDIELCDSPNDCKAVYCNGVFYWFYWDISTHEFTITCFDFGDEVFRSIPLPDYVQRKVRKLKKNPEFGVWNESLVLLSFHWGDPAFIDMWVMNSNSNVADAEEVSYSWTKHLTIGPLVHITKSLVFWGNELYLRAESGEIVSYNLSTKELTHHSVYFERFGVLVVYVKSLVSVHKKARSNSTVESIHPDSGLTCP